MVNWQIDLTGTSHDDAAIMGMIYWCHFQPQNAVSDCKYVIVVPCNLFFLCFIRFYCFEEVHDDHPFLRNASQNDSFSDTMSSLVP